jgi:hypothetical protein
MEDERNGKTREETSKDQNKKGQGLVSVDIGDCR